MSFHFDNLLGRIAKTVYILVKFCQLIFWKNSLGPLIISTIKVVRHWN